MDEVPEQVAAVHLKRLRRRVRSDEYAGDRVGRSQVECAVRSPAVVVTDVDTKNVLKLAAPTFNTAFEIRGDAVPEPASLMLLGSGLVVLTRRLTRGRN